MTHADNSLPELHPADGPWSIYLHVPFCASRCGYCDFNTYVLSAMGDDAVAGYLDAAHQELELAADALGDAQPPVSTIFFGGGTPTMLSPVQLGELIDHIRTLWGIDPDAEVTTEANPETLSVEVLAGLLKAGINRLSMGMQSADEYVLTVLDRRHRPGRAVEMAQLARQVGFDDVSLDLIFGAPGENFDSWRHSLDVTLTAEPDHISAYSLIVEEGTRLAGRIRRGELPMTDEDDLADKYLLTEKILTEAGYVNYEVSNWARPRSGRDHRCRHNMAYWLGYDWWGIGPGLILTLLARGGGMSNTLPPTGTCWVTECCPLTTMRFLVMCSVMRRRCFFGCVWLMGCRWRICPRLNVCGLPRSSSRGSGRWRRGGWYSTCQVEWWLTESLPISWSSRLHPPGRQVGR